MESPSCNDLSLQKIFKVKNELSVPSFSSLGWAKLATLSYTYTIQTCERRTYTPAWQVESCVVEQPPGVCVWGVPVCWGGGSWPQYDIKGEYFYLSYLLRTTSLKLSVNVFGCISSVVVVSSNMNEEHTAHVLRFYWNQKKLLDFDMTIPKMRFLVLFCGLYC